MKIYLPFTQKKNLVDGNNIPSLDLRIVNLTGFYIDPSVNYILIKVYCDQLYESMTQTKFISFFKNTETRPLQVVYNYYLDSIHGGQCFDMNDTDQYATYHLIGVYQPVFDYISGSYLNDVNYISCLIGTRTGSGINFATTCTDNSHFEYYLNTQQKLDENPFLSGSKSSSYYPRNNSSVFFTERQELLYELETDFIYESSSSLFSGSTGFNQTTGQIYVYRLDQQSTQGSFAGEEATDGCLSTYLFCKTGVFYKSFPYGIMRVKIPYTYDSSLPLIQPMKQYDTLYYSVSAMQYSELIQPPFAPFWTVNARMMKTYQDTSGYAYIFWAPQSDVMLINESQKTTKKIYEPPVISWGQYKGYLLCAPTFTWYFRYKDPNPDWEGSPINCPCYLDPNTNQPITDELGPWCPELYGGAFSSYDAFMNSSNIGSVVKNQPWPN
jgi:hypothetical protein